MIQEHFPDLTDIWLVSLGAIIIVFNRQFKTRKFEVQCHSRPSFNSVQCRIVTTEELEGKLNENRVKQITGNSCVTFRNMYESSQGGIPTAKLFTTTNNLPDCRATEAFQDRVVAILHVSF
ncbi:SF3 helicase domain-containing protein [Trichonephila clavipes]|nr:SF3 helicase domain-containing protein [Trichonephila clavipes]